MPAPAIVTELLSAVRALRRTPLVSGSAIVCIALGIGSTSAISSAISRALLQPLPFREPERLVTVYRTTPHFDTGPFSPANYADLARETRQLEALAAMTPTTGLLQLTDGAAQVTLKRVTGNLFPILGVRALRGRLLTPADDQADAPQAIVLGEELWNERFGGDPALVGKPVRLDGQSYTVVGIAPRELGIPHGAQVIRSQAWVPMRFSPNELSQRRSNYLYALGRLAPGATTQTAHAELVRLFDGIVTANPALRGEQVRALSLVAEGVRSVQKPLLLLFGAVCMVLLIASTNVASLLLARSVQRRRELAVRSALGASRRQLMRPVLSESLVMTAIGLVAGLALAWAGVRTIGTLAATRLPQLQGLTVDYRVIAFAVVLAGVVALVCGGIPAWRSAAVDPQDALRSGRGGGTSRAQHRVLQTLVVAEVALSLILLVGAGLVLKGFSQLMSRDPGFDPAEILTLQTTISPERYQDGSSVQRFLEPALQKIREIPGVDAAGSISLIPYDNWGWNFNIRYEGQSGEDPTRLPITENRVVTPDFYAVTKQRLIAGRLLAEQDDGRPQSPNVVVVNQALVKRDFPDKDPIGKRFHNSDTSFATIVGVVSDIRNFGPVEEPRAEVYRPYRQWGNGSSNFALMIRAKRGNPANLTAAVRAAILSVDQQTAITDVRTMPQVMAQSTGRARFYLMLLGVFAGVAVVLAVAGIYGVLSYAVAQRTREFGIRSALGSTPSMTLALVTREGMGLITTGIVLGLMGSAAATRLLTAMLYGVSPLDRATWATTTAILIGVGLLATLVPASRATRADPLLAIRSD
ncbi:MAG TPA: ABC transporter permease [Gemmatimonadaceae bacterium]|nr:ABC transporter permease [Gemmatimonadaceae bacterium]